MSRLFDVLIGIFNVSLVIAVLIAGIRLCNQLGMDFAIFAFGTWYFIGALLKRTT